MKTYTVINTSGYNETFFSLSAAKKAMKENNARGYITKTYANGDWENCGEITLKGSNRTFLANTKQTTKSYK